MTTDEIRHYRNGYAIGEVLARFKADGLRVTGTHTKPRPYPAPRIHPFTAAHNWGIATAMAGRAPLF